MKDTAIKITILLIAAFALALSVNHFSPRGIPLVGQWDTEVGVVTADTDTAALWMAFELPDPVSAKKVYDSGSAVFVDVRSRGSYAEGHIPGAVSLPVAELDEIGDAFVKEVALQQRIVTYCSGRLCQDSHTAAQWLMEKGFENIVVYIDGFPGWVESGYPVEK